jgi:23S rRNA (uracil1939-C5)-methyltransferase
MKLAPKRIVYVSCNPETLARDLYTLSKGGYKVRRIQPVDMFPWTGHAEVVVALERKNGE